MTSILERDGRSREIVAGADEVIVGLLQADAGCRFCDIVSEWHRVQRLEFEELDKVTCAEPWSTKGLQTANAFNRDVESKYVILRVGAKRCVVSWELAERLLSATG